MLNSTYLGKKHENLEEKKKDRKKHENTGGKLSDKNDPDYVVYGFSAGQMQNEAACETLEKVLGNTSDDCMVRHEVNSGPVLREVD